MLERLLLLGVLAGLGSPASAGPPEAGFGAAPSARADGQDPAAEIAALALRLADEPAGPRREELAAEYAAAALALARAVAGESRRATLLAALARLASIERQLTGEAPAEAPARATRVRLEVELASLWLELGRLDADPSALAHAEEGFARAIASAEDGVPIALRAELGAGECAAARGAHAKAAERFAAVAERAVPSDARVWSEAAAGLSREDRARRFALLELATPGRVAALAADGRGPEALRAGLHWWRIWRREAFALSAPGGELSALEVARVASSSEGLVAWRDDAREAEWFEDESAARGAGATTLAAPRDFAVLLLSSALDARGDRLGPSALRGATELVARGGIAADDELVRRLARAAFAAGAWSDAASLFERCGASPTGADGGRGDLAAERLWHLGRCAEELGDSIAATAHFREVVELHRDSPPWAARAAEGWYRLLLARRGEPQQASDEQELAAATRAARELGSGPIAADAAYRDAERLLRERRFAQARAALEAVPPEALPFELAWVYRAVCDYQTGALDPAERALREFIEVRLADPRHAPADAARAQRRTQARAVAELYYGLIAYARAERGDGDWAVVRARLEPYLARHGSQQQLAPLAAARALTACLRLGDFAAAEILEGELFEAFPESPYTAAAALEMYRERETRRAALDGGDPERSTRLLRAMARELELANRSATEPSFANLRAESRAWLELGERVRARIVLDRIVRLFGERERESVERWVLPDLALALAQDGEPARAAELLAPLVDANRADARVVRLYARVLGGWCEFDAAGAATEHDGVGDGPSYARAAELYSRLLAAETRFETGWYDLRFDALYARWRRGAADAPLRAKAKAELEGLVSELGPGFERLADARLAARFRWLTTIVR